MNTFAVMKDLHYKYLKELAVQLLIKYKSVILTSGANYTYCLSCVVYGISDLIV